MSTTIKLPSLGESVESARIVAIQVAVGDEVGAEDPVFEVETDKATLDVPAEEAGRVAEILVAVGDDVEVGQDVLVLESAEDSESGGDDEQGEADEADEQDGVGDPAAERGSGEDEDERDSEERSRETRAEAGEERHETEEQAEDDDADRSASAKGDDGPSEQQSTKSERGDQVENETEAAPAADSDGESAEATAKGDAGKRSKARREAGAGDAAAPPHVRRMARELGVDLAEVAAEDAVRVTEADLFAHVRARLERSAPRGAQAGSTLPDFEEWGPVERQPIDGVRRVTGEKVLESWRRIPQVTHFDSARVGDLQDFRRRHEADDGPVSLTAVIAKVVAEVLRQFPRANASFDEDALEIVLRRSIHLGIAVDTERGLLVPVLHDVQDLGIREIAARLSELVASAHSGDLSPDQLAGGSFTLSNVGMLGGSHFTPIVPWPQVAILGLGRVEPQVVRDAAGEFVEAAVLPLSLSYDHRVLDGGDAARFCRRVAEALEDPMSLWMSG